MELHIAQSKAQLPLAEDARMFHTYHANHIEVSFHFYLYRASKASKLKKHKYLYMYISEL